MNERWIKPDFQEISVCGECTAYAGTPDAVETSPLSAIRSPLSAQDESGERTADCG